MNFKKIFLLSSVSIMALASCSSEVDLNQVVFKNENIVQSNFGGLGVEWGVYEDTDKLTPLSYERIYKYIKKLNPARIRCMFNYDWFIKDFNDFNDNDKTNDTWSYDFSNKNGANLDMILSYCQENNIQVALGAWNVPGNSEDASWNMLDDLTSDIRWAKISGDVFEYLVKQKGYTCIRWFVNSNEPNYKGTSPSHKNYNNTFEKWAKGVKQVREELDKRGLQNIAIVGGDTTGLEGTTEYWTGISESLTSYVGDYGYHLYPSNLYIDRGQILDLCNELIKPIKEKDKGLGTSRPLNIWECGLLDGKDNATDSNILIKTVSYAVRMADFTVQSLLAGFNGICYWSFDDAQNFIYNSTTPTPKRWGMFSSLSSDQAYDQELRPWFHSSYLMSNLMRPGAVFYGTPVNDSKLDNTFRVVGVNNPGTDLNGFVALNRGTKEVTKKFVFDQDILSSGNLYIYEFGEGSIRLNEEGYIIPNYQISGTLNKTLEINIKANSLLIVSSKEL